MMESIIHGHDLVVAALVPGVYTNYICNGIWGCRNRHLDASVELCSFCGVLSAASLPCDEDNTSIPFCVSTP